MFLFSMEYVGYMKSLVNSFSASGYGCIHSPTQVFMMWESTISHGKFPSVFSSQSSVQLNCVICLKNQNVQVSEAIKPVLINLYEYSTASLTAYHTSISVVCDVLVWGQQSPHWCDGR